MNIVVDLRALAGNKISGVKIYLISLLEEIFQIDKKNQYFLWWNSATENFPRNLKIPRSSRFKIIYTKFSNRILNFKLTFANSPKIDELIFKKIGLRPQIFWLPDPRPIVLSKNCRLVATIHDLSSTIHPEFFSWKTRIWHYFLDSKKIAYTANRILTVSNSTKNDLEKIWKISSEKITVTPLSAAENLKRTSTALVRKKYSLPPKFALSLSTLEPRKNLMMLIHAFTKFKKESNSSVELVLAGNFDCKIFANPKIHMRNFVKILGEIPESEKSALLSAAEVFCFPSIYEGFGIPLLEAMKCGTSVLAADIPALREIGGDAAKFLPPKNIDKWEFALQEIFTNESLRKDLIKRGLAQSKKFSWRKTAQLTLASFEDAVK